MPNLLAISREVMLAFSDISCKMALRVSGPPCLFLVHLACFWSTCLVSLFFFECEVIIHRLLVFSYFIFNVFDVLIQHEHFLFVGIVEC